MWEGEIVGVVNFLNERDPIPPNTSIKPYVINKSRPNSYAGEIWIVTVPT